MSTIGFVGLGNMGSLMAHNLIKGGYTVRGFDINQSAVDLFQTNGGIAVKSAKEVVKNAEIIISMLPADRHVESLYCTDQKLLDYIDPDTLVIDSSTISATTVKKISARADKKRIFFMDAPVSGGIAGAAKGTLTFIVGGTKERLQQAQSVLNAMGNNVFLAGPVGCGQIAKMCNNMLLAILMSGTSETLALGAANGLDLTVLSNIISKSSGSNWVLNLYNPVPGIMANVPANINYEGGFMTKLMLKDLTLALSSANENNASTPMGSLAKNLFALHAKSGNESLDFSSIYKLFAHE